MKPRPPGRPPIAEDDPSVAISVSLPSKQLAALDAHAKHDRMTLQDWIRHALERAARDE